MNKIKNASLCVLALFDFLTFENITDKTFYIAPLIRQFIHRSNILLTMMTLHVVFKSAVYQIPVSGPYL